MVEKADAGVYVDELCIVGGVCGVEDDVDVDLSLVGCAGDGGLAWRRHWKGEMKVEKNRHQQKNMASSLRATTRLVRFVVPPHTRKIFSFFLKHKPPQQQHADSLFYKFSDSPYPALRARSKAIQQLAPCPVCATDRDHDHPHTRAQPCAVKFECPDCGWPTHCSEEHHAQDQEHHKYCSRLREVNEDEHDLRSGRHLREFELPGSFLISAIYLALST